MKYSTILYCVCFLYLCSCKTKTNPSSAFYYWKTSFNISSFEKAVLNKNHVHKIYLRCFDVDLKPGTQEVVPLAPLSNPISLDGYQVVPVVFIKNRVFSHKDSVAEKLLAKRVYSMVNAIMEKTGSSKPVEEIQFDCDWTDATQQSYFAFLGAYRSLSTLKISATIRLHQVKYFTRTGVPPVDKGVLMYYNMGEINAGDKNSVYERSIALKYIQSLSGYPLPLDVALPVFAWAQQIRNQQVVQLLNKVSATDFAADTNFVFFNPGRLRVKNACFKSGYYFQQDDEVKLETIEEKMLYEMSDDISKRLKQQPGEIIFYDLDSINMIRYDKELYQKLGSRFN